MEAKEKNLVGNKYNYWQHQMLDIIKISHPYLFRIDKQELTNIVVLRAEEAYEVYVEAIKDNKPIYMAREEAREVLLEGYKWSPTDFLGTILWEENKENADETRVVDLYYNLKSIFDKYSFNKLFEDSDYEEELREEVINALN